MFAAYLSNITGHCARNNVRVHCNSLTGCFMGQISGVSRLEALSRLRLNTIADEWILQFTSCRMSIHPCSDDKPVFNLARLDAVTDANKHIMHQCIKLFRGLGCMSEPYRIQLKSDTRPYAVYAHIAFLCYCCQRLRMKLTGYSALASSSMSTSLLRGVRLLLWRPKFKVYSCELIFLGEMNQ